MNDFTKEELEDLECTIKSLQIYLGNDCYDEELLFKIQTMIANYCEHNGDTTKTDGEPIMCCLCNRAIL